MPEVQGADARHRFDRRSRSRPAHPGAPGIVGAAAHRAQSTGRSRELAPACQLATDLSPGARHRLSCRTESHASKQSGGGKALALLWCWE